MADEAALKVALLTGISESEAKASDDHYAWLEEQEPCPLIETPIKFKAVFFSEDQFYSFQTAEEFDLIFNRVQPTLLYGSFYAGVNGRFLLGYAPKSSYFNASPYTFNQRTLKIVLPFCKVLANRIPLENWALLLGCLPNNIAQFFTILLKERSD